MLRSRLPLLAWLLALLAAPAPAAPVPPPVFGVSAHSHVGIEWWYVNAHVSTEQGRHLALIGSFFRFGSGTSPFDPAAPAPRAYYLIYAVTDLDAKTQRSYSLADSSMVRYLRQIAPFLAVQNPHDKGAQALLAAVNAGTLPPPHQKLSGKASVINSPFRLAYGPTNTLTADNAANTSFTLNLDAGGADKVHLTLAAQKPPMAVGGTGETGLVKKNDMFYFSLTRCAVGGTIDTGHGPERITGGAGWFDHQWGNSWVAQGNGWDWWGVQLSDGTDILCFRQRDLKTGRVFFPLATFMDKAGHQSVTHNIGFNIDTSQPLWKSPRTGVSYPLAWTLTFPDKNLLLHITASVPDQEMPILGPGSAIWEGSCAVTEHPFPPSKAAPCLSTSQQPGYYLMPLATGSAYMELVGYGSPAVRGALRHSRKPHPGLFGHGKHK